MMLELDLEMKNIMFGQDELEMNSLDVFTSFKYGFGDSLATIYLIM